MEAGVITIPKHHAANNRIGLVSQPPYIVRKGRGDSCSNALEMILQ